MCFKRTTPAFQRCKNEQKRCSYSRERVARRYDATRWRADRTKAVALPKLDALAPHERLYIKGGTPETKRALRVELRPRRGPTLDAINARRPSGRARDVDSPWRRVAATPRVRDVDLSEETGRGDAAGARRGYSADATIRDGRRLAQVHLDAAGSNAHRTRQFAAAVSGRARGRLLVAGDTNCFAPARAAQTAALDTLLAPARRRGARDAHARAPRDTHWFARTTEPGVGHRAVAEPLRVLRDAWHGPRGGSRRRRGARRG